MKNISKKEAEVAAEGYRHTIQETRQAFLEANEQLLKLYEQGLLEDWREETECRYNIAFVNRHSNINEN